MNMEKIIAKVDAMAEKCIVTIDNIDRDYKDDVSFTKGENSFWIHSNNEEITLEIYTTKPYKKIDGEVIRVIDNEGTHYTSTSEEFILKKLSEVINDKELYIERAEELRERMSRLVVKIEEYRKKKVEATTDADIEKYSDYVKRRMETYQKLSREYKTCTNFEEYTIIEKGSDDKVLVEWHREKSMMFPTGKEYSIHTRTSTGALMFGRYFMKKEICVEEFEEKYGKGGMR